MRLDAGGAPHASASSSSQMLEDRESTRSHRTESPQSFVRLCRLFSINPHSFDSKLVMNSAVHVLLFPWRKGQETKVFHISSVFLFFLTFLVRLAHSARYITVAIHILWISEVIPESCTQRQNASRRGTMAYLWWLAAMFDNWDDLWHFSGKDTSCYCPESCVLDPVKHKSHTHTHTHAHTHTRGLRGSELPHLIFSRFIFFWGAELCFHFLTGPSEPLTADLCHLRTRLGRYWIILECPILACIPPTDWLPSWLQSLLSTQLKTNSSRPGETAGRRLFL